MIYLIVTLRKDRRERCARIALEGNLVWTRGRRSRSNGRGSIIHEPASTTTAGDHAPIHQEGPPVTPETSPPDPAVILDLLEAFRRSKVMFAAVSLGIFDTLEDGPEIGGRAGRDARRCTRTRSTRLLDAAIGLKLLERRGDAYENTPAASAYLCKRSPSRLTGLHQLFRTPRCGSSGPTSRTRCGRGRTAGSRRSAGTARSSPASSAPRTTSASS